MEEVTIPFEGKVFFYISDKINKITATKNTSIVFVHPVIRAIVVLYAEVKLIMRWVIVYICPPELFSVVPASVNGPIALFSDGQCWTQQENGSWEVRSGHFICLSVLGLLSELLGHSSFIGPVRQLPYSWRHSASLGYGHS